MLFLWSPSQFSFFKINNGYKVAITTEVKANYHYLIRCMKWFMKIFSNCKHNFGLDTILVQPENGPKWTEQISP